jgi:hypothetical protein
VSERDATEDLLRELRFAERDASKPIASAIVGELPDGRPMLHRPDLVVRDDGRTMAIEVELTPKAPRRLDRIVRSRAGAMITARGARPVRASRRPRSAVSRGLGGRRIGRRTPSHQRETARKRAVLGLSSGGGGIRTLDGPKRPITVFETAAFNHSATPPRWRFSRLAMRWPRGSGSLSPLDPASARGDIRPDQENQSDQDADDAQRIVDEDREDDPDHDQK